MEVASLCVYAYAARACATHCGSWLQDGLRHSLRPVADGLRLTTRVGVVGLVEHAFDALFGSIKFGLDTTEFALTQVEPGGEGECL